MHSAEGFTVGWKGEEKYATATAVKLFTKYNNLIIARYTSFWGRCSDSGLNHREKKHSTVRPQTWNAGAEVM